MYVHRTSNGKRIAQYTCYAYSKVPVGTLCPTQHREKYETFDEMTNPMLLELVDKVLVHERNRKGSMQTTQEIEIYFNFVGKFIPPDFEKELTEEEIAEMKRIEEIKDKRHQAYLRRKESGWQAQYEAKQKAKKKALMDKKKNAIRQEDIKKGIFIPVSSMPEKEPKKVVQA